MQSISTRRALFGLAAFIGLASSALPAETPKPPAPPDRFAALKYSDLTPRQKVAADAYQTMARKMIGGEGPYDIDSKLMAAAYSSVTYVSIRSPELADRALTMQLGLREGAVPRKLNELAVM